MIRFVLIAIFLVLFLVLSLPVLLVEWILGKCGASAAKDRSCKAIVGWAFRVIQFLSGVKLIVKGKENIPKDTAVLYVGNHRSFYDVILTLSLFPGVTGYVAKKELDKAPSLRLWMRAIHCLFLDRENIKEGLKTILAGVELVKSGVSLCIFPEGTRNKVEGTFLPFHEGSFKIAEKGGVPVVPMALCNTAAVFEDHFPKVRSATVVIEFCQPIDPKTLPKEERKNLCPMVKAVIEETYARNRAEYYPAQAE